MDLKKSVFFIKHPNGLTKFIKDFFYKITSEEKAYPQEFEGRFCRF
jgi:hypothetical protein